MKPTPPAKHAAPDLVGARLSIECMEEQKERMRALISVLQGILNDPDTPPDVRTLLDIAAQTCEDHKHWYDLRRSLGLGDGHE